MDNKYTNDDPDATETDEDFSEPYGTIEPCTDEECPCQEDY